MPTLWDAIVDALASPQLIIALVWSGMAALTVSLVVLMRTQWGQHRPLRKCVVLSLFAHLLFAAYATTIHVVRTHPGHGHGTAMRITAVDGHDAVDVNGTADGIDNSKDRAPWDMSTASLPVEPTVPDLPPAETFKPPIAPTPVEAVSPAALADRMKDARDEPPLPMAEIRPTTAVVHPEPIETAPAQQQATAPAIGPQPDGLDRPADAATALADKDGGDKELARLVSRIAPPPVGPAPIAAEQDGFPADEGTIKVASPAPADLSDMGPLVTVRPRSGATNPASSSPVPSAVGRPNFADGRNGRCRRHAKNRSAHRAGDVSRAVGAEPPANRRGLRWLGRNRGRGERRPRVARQAPGRRRPLGCKRSWRRARNPYARPGSKRRRSAGRYRSDGPGALGLSGAGHTHQAGAHAKSVERGIDYLLASQAGDGNLAGRAEVYAYMYCHGMAALALSEAYAMTGDPRLARPVRRAVAYTVAAQNLASGGWRYKPNERGDTSQLGWQLMAVQR